MQRVPHMRGDRILALISLLAFTVCTLLFVAVLAHCGFESALWRGSPLSNDLLAALALAIGGGTVVRLSCANARDEVTRRTVILCVVGLLLAMGGAHVWFGAPMHDLALAMDDHGRWCGSLDANGNPYYIIRTETAPAMLFVPLIALVAWRGWRMAPGPRARIRQASLDRNLRR